MKKNLILLITFALLYACKSETPMHDEHDHAHEERMSLTQWSERTELFAEFDAPEPGVPVEFIIHLTDLNDNSPLTEAVNFKVFSETDSFSEENVTIDRPGIYTPEFTLNKGHYRLEISISDKYDEKILTDEIPVHIHVHEAESHSDEIDDEDHIAHADEDSHEGEEHDHRHEGKSEEDEHDHHHEAVTSVFNGGGSISFPKEQQWNIDFGTSVAALRNLSNSVNATADIISRLNNDVIIAAPFTGIVLPDHNPKLPLIGERVEEGEQMIVLTPTVEGDSEQNFAGLYIERESALKLSEIELERAKRLYEKEAISLRELQTAQAVYDEAKANFGSMTTFVKKYKMVNEDGREHPDLDFIVKSPLRGIVEEVYFKPGEEIRVGAPLYRVIDINKVWVKVNLPVTEVGKIHKPNRFSFTVHGMERTFNVDKSCCRLVSFGNLVEGANRTVPIIFEVENNEQQLKLGMFADVNLYTGEVREVVSIPESALIEDEGNYFVFIQKSGEGFEKQQVKIGIKDNDFVEIVDGLELGERVVVRGNYQVKLASQVAGIPDHGHSH